MSDTIQELRSFIEKSPTAFHAVATCKEMLIDHGFAELYESEEWELACGEGYFVSRNGSSIIAFRMPARQLLGCQMAAAHCDSPVLKLKPNLEIDNGFYAKLDVEKYGGALLAPWFDRPLSIAGRIVTRIDNGIKSYLVDAKRDIAMIPNLAIHMDRDQNSGKEYKVQTDMLPIVASNGCDKSLIEVLTDDADWSSDDVLAADLFLYNTDESRIWGLDNEFVSARHLDDLQCAYALMKALAQTEVRSSRLQLCAVFDNEEIGSSTKQGADSTFLTDVFDRICENRNLTASQKRCVLANSLMASADNSHAVHPNHPEKADPNNRPVMNGGIVIKHSANQAYATDAVSTALFKLICENAKVPIQEFANHSDIPGGSTLGNILNTHLSVNTVDIGLAQLAMHSPYETAGVHDTDYLVRAMEEFYMSVVIAENDGGYRLL